MSSVVRRFNRFDKRTERTPTHFYGRESEANTLRRELDEMERDAERAVAQAQRLIERERMREGER